MIAHNGLGAAGCPTNENGECMYNGMPVSCSLIRECDSVTGTLHWEYGMPFSTGNVNILVGDPSTQSIVGYRNADGTYIDTPDITIDQARRNLTAQNQIAAVTSAILNAEREARLRAASLGLTPMETTRMVIEAMNAAAVQAAARGGSANVVNGNAGSTNQGAVVNTGQTTTTQQGNAGNTNVTNTNATSGNAATPSLNFNDLITGGKSWFAGESFGISNTYLALGLVAALALSGGGFIGGRRSRF